jgi:uncharacterized protein YoxC
MKLIIKLALVIAGLYLLMQIPFFNQYIQKLKADIMEKVHNVTTEVDRVQGKITGIEQQAIEAKDKVNAVANDLGKTANNVKDAFVSVDKAAEDIKKAMNGEGAKTTENLQDPKPATTGTPTPSTATPTPTPTPTK